MDGWKEFIPDFIGDGDIGDVKDVQEQSLDEQLSAFYVLGKQVDPHTRGGKMGRTPDDKDMDKPRKFHLVYRAGTEPEDNPTGVTPHSEGVTKLSGPLKSALDFRHPIITDDREVGEGDA